MERGTDVTGPIGMESQAAVEALLRQRELLPAAAGTAGDGQSRLDGQ